MQSFTCDEREMKLFPPLTREHQKFDDIIIKLCEYHESLRNEGRFSESDSVRDYLETFKFKVISFKNGRTGLDIIKSDGIAWNTFLYFYFFYEMEANYNDNLPSYRKRRFI